MQILITGNMGYVGPGVVRHLRASHPEATLAGLDMGYFAHCLTNAAQLPESRLNVQHYGDVRHVPEQALAGVDAIVHLAAISNDPMGHAFEEVTLAINHRASISLAQKAKAAGVKRFVFASSCSVYGFAESGPRTEQSEVNPLTAYARSKVLTERDLAGLAGPNFRVVCLRFPTACGMSDRLRLDLVLNDFVAGAVASKKITVLSDGSPWRPLINVRDMARAIDWAVHYAGDLKGNYLVVNAGSTAWNFQVKDLAEAVARHVPGVEVSINRNAQPDKRSYRVDFALYESLAPQHQPQMDLATTILELKNGLEGMNFTDSAFRNSQLMRLNVLTHLRQQGQLTEQLAWSSASPNLVHA
jgi:nucleoside-diphosphate-sugar epimerase